MFNLFKYRKLSILILIILIVFYLLSFVAFWNIILVNQLENEGWLMILFTFLFLTGVALFLIVYSLTDQERLNNYVEFVISKDKVPEAEDIAESSTDEEVDKRDYNELSAGIARKASKAKNLNGLCDSLLRSLSDHIGLVKGIMYVKDEKTKLFSPAGYFAFTGDEPESFMEGEGIAGQAVADREPIRINDIPEDYSVTSGLGNSQPRNILFFPVINDDKAVALLELGFFKRPGRDTEELIAHFSLEAVKLLNNHFSRIS